jgi:hypothetical protein
LKKTLPQKILNWIPTGRRTRERPKYKDGKKAYSVIGRIWSMRWRLGGQTSLEIGCQKTLPYVTE